MKKSFLVTICLLFSWGVSSYADEQKIKVKKEPSSRQTEQSSASSHRAASKEKTVHSSEKIPADTAVSFPQDI